MLNSLLYAAKKSSGFEQDRFGDHEIVEYQSWDPAEHWQSQRRRIFDEHLNQAQKFSISGSELDTLTDFLLAMDQITRLNAWNYHLIGVTSEEKSMIDKGKLTVEALHQSRHQKGLLKAEGYESSYVHVSPMFPRVFEDGNSYQNLWGILFKGMQVFEKFYQEKGKDFRFRSNILSPAVNQEFRNFSAFYFERDNGLSLSEEFVYRIIEVGLFKVLGVQQTHSENKARDQGIGIGSKAKYDDKNILSGDVAYHAALAVLDVEYHRQQLLAYLDSPPAGVETGHINRDLINRIFDNSIAKFVMITKTRVGYDLANLIERVDAGERVYAEGIGIKDADGNEVVAPIDVIQKGLTVYEDHLKKEVQWTRPATRRYNPVKMIGKVYARASNM